MQGVGVCKDAPEAAEYIQLAADQGHIEAQYDLGVCYVNSVGVTKNESEAVRYMLVADQGQMNANAEWSQLSRSAKDIDLEENIAEVSDDT